MKSYFYSIRCCVILKFGKIPVMIVNSWLVHTNFWSKVKAIYGEFATPKAYRVMQVLNRYKYFMNENIAWKGKKI